ncbi:CHAT domain-containing protein [Pedobacter sp. MC2016-14]|uniref:CHAT domain-containing protein n=1 Tax=Pedobacter sp. MC2016-14 TaxID=2897327 RepID=UPI001E4C47F5|nr:CHAT domain-containing protein [Pedobacter sp. MC2016-14]MCD0488147.1 CHAT domain-containing protein [Pedobacter sp. MC2016-14]
MQPGSFKWLKAYLVALALVFYLGNAHALIPWPEPTKQMQELKKQNNLAEWLYLRMDYNYANPKNRLPFLMQTQKETWRKPISEAEKSAWMMLLSNQGYYQLQAADILNSINCYEEAYSFFYQHKLKNFDVVEYVLKPLSNNYTRLGDYERSIFIHTKALAQLNPVSQGDEMASIYSNMAICYHSMGNYLNAEACIEKGRNLTKSAELQFNLNTILAEVYLELRMLKKANILIKSNLKSIKQINENNAYGLMGLYTTLGKVNLKSKEAAQAIENFRMALKLLKRWYPDGRLREKANLYAQLGTALRLKNEPQKAIDIFNAALQLLKVNTPLNQTQVSHIYGENKLAEIFEQKAITYATLGNDAGALKNMQYALMAMDKIRKEFADDKTKERLQQEAKAMAEEAIGIAYGIHQKTRKQAYLNLILEIAEQTKSRTLADQIQRNKLQLLKGGLDVDAKKRQIMESALRYNERKLMTELNASVYQKNIDALKFDLALLNKKNRAQEVAVNTSAADLLHSLPPTLQVIEFFVGSKSIFLITIQNRKVKDVQRIDQSEVLKNNIRKLVNTYYQHGPDMMLNSPKAFFTLSNAVYRQLLGGIVFSKNEKLCIIPDDLIGYLSFDGLVTSNTYIANFSDWPFLIKRLQITYAFSLSTLSPGKKATDQTSHFSGLFITHQGKAKQALPAVINEADSIGNIIKGTYLFDKQVTTKSFFKEFDRSDLLHISTHAYLTGDRKEPTLDFGTEKLFLFELQSRKNKPRLIVLSACRTGDGLLAEAEGIISLSRGFIAIGTPATIAGLWNVNDDAGAKITADMYRELVKGQSSGEALQHAKLKWLNTAKASSAMYLPYYWDSLILMGTDEAIPLQASTSISLYLILCAAIVFFAFAFIIIRRKGL